MFYNWSIRSCSNRMQGRRESNCYWRDMRLPECSHTRRQSWETFIAPLLLKVNPFLQPYVTPGGTIVVELNRALYGCIESAKLWFEELTNTLINMGFSPNDCDLWNNPTSNLLAVVTVVSELSQGWDVLYWIVVILYRCCNKLQPTTRKPLNSENSMLCKCA